MKFIVKNSLGSIVRTGECQPHTINAQADPLADEVAEPADGPLPMSDYRAALLQRAAHRRWEVESGGTPFAGGRMDTDDRAKLMLTGAMSAAQLNPNFKTRWKFGHSWREVGGADVAAAYAAVFAHVEACFAREEALAAAIAAATTAEELHALAQQVEEFAL